MKSKVLMAFKDAVTGVRYEVGQTYDANVDTIAKLEKYGLVSKVEVSEPKKTTKK